tara:strand:+ start:683 stop:826 length:144 start_codon:yes stop_codon:yes gene_type:complete
VKSKESGVRLNPHRDASGCLVFWLPEMYDKIVSFFKSKKTKEKNKHV